MPSSRTIVSYRPTPDEEEILDALSRRFGLSKSRTLAFALRRVAEQEYIHPDTRSVELTPEEQRAVDELYAELPADYWRRRRVLETHQRDGLISEEQREELLSLIERGEEWNVRRLEFLFELARRHGAPRDHFLDALDLRHHPLDRKAV